MYNKQKKNDLISKDMPYSELKALLNKKRVTDDNKAKIQIWLVEKEKELEKDTEVWLHGFNVRCKRLITLAQYHIMRDGKRHFIIDKINNNRRVIIENLDEYTKEECRNELIDAMFFVMNELNEQASKVKSKGKKNGLDGFIDLLYLKMEEQQDEQQEIPYELDDTREIQRLQKLVTRK